MHADQAQARRLGKRYAELTPVVETYRELQALAGDLATARELAAEDESFRAEVPALEARQDELEDTAARAAAARATRTTTRT